MFSSGNIRICNHYKGLVIDRQPLIFLTSYILFVFCLQLIGNTMSSIILQSILESFEYHRHARFPKMRAVDRSAPQRDWPCYSLRAWVQVLVVCSLYLGSVELLLSLALGLAPIRLAVLLRWQLWIRRPAGVWIRRALQQREAAHHPGQPRHSATELGLSPLGDSAGWAIQCS